MKPAWDQLGDEYASSSSVLIADVDCTVEQDLCSEYDVKGDKCGLLGLEEHGNFGNHTTRAGRKRYRVASPRYQKARPVDASLLKLASANAVNKVSDLRKEVSVFAGRGGEGRGAVLPPFATRLCRGCRGTDARGPGVGPVDATDTTA